MTPPTSRIPTAGRALFRWVFFALAAALALAVVQLAFELNNLRNENAALKSGRDLAEVAAKSAQIQLRERSLVAEGMINELGRQLRGKNDLSRFKSFSLLPPSPDERGPLAVVVWDVAAQTAQIAVVRLPAHAGDQEYRWWVIDAAGRRFPCGDFQNGRDEAGVSTVHPVAPVPRVVGMALTLEMKADTLEPAGTTILEGTFKE